MPVSEEFIVFGDVACFLARSSLSEVRDGQKDNMHLEKKRFAVITKDQSGTLFLEIYKDKSKYKNGTPKFSDRLRQSSFCGITHGNIVAGEGGRGPKKSETYLALIFVDYTLIVLVPKEAAILAKMDEWERRCEHALHHVQTKRVCLDLSPMKEGRDFLPPGTQVLLGLTKYRLSICCLEDHHRCLHSWTLDHVNVLEEDSSSTTLRLLVLGHGIYIFSARSPSNTIFEHIRSVTGDAAQGRVIQPSYTTFTRGTPAPSQRRASDQTRPISCNAKHRCGISKQLVPRDGAPLPHPPDLVPEDDYLPPVEERQATHQSSVTPCRHCSDVYAEYFDYGENTGEGEYCVDLNEYVEKAYQGTSSHRRGSHTEAKLPQWCRTKTEATASAPLVPLSTKKHATAGPPEWTNRQSLPRQMSLTEVLPESNIADSQGSSSEVHFFNTLEKVLQGIAPRVDTLKLPHTQRVQLCIKLYLPSPKTAGTSMESWELFAQAIGLRWEAVDLISTIVRNHRLVIPAAEVVLRHWQYIYNKYGYHGPNGKCPYECTKDQLAFILREHVAREDLVELIERGSRSTSHS